MYFILSEVCSHLKKTDLKFNEIFNYENMKIELYKKQPRQELFITRNSVLQHRFEWKLYKKLISIDFDGLKLKILMPPH